MITKLTKHDTHKMRIHLCKGQGPHYAALRCVSCNKHVQWLSKQDSLKMSALGVDYYITKDNI